MKDLNKINFNRINRLEILLDNAISFLIDELSKYYDIDEAFEVIQYELGCTAEELSQYGIKF